MEKPRGLRNNNPLNIVHTKDKWKGAKSKQTDKRFVQFTDMKYGYRAAFIIMNNYYKKHGIKTIAGVIRRWVQGESYNDYLAYLNTVLVGLRDGQYDVQPGTVLPPPSDDCEIWGIIALLMTVQENGRRYISPAIVDEIFQGWKLAFCQK